MRMVLPIAALLACFAACARKHAPDAFVTRDALVGTFAYPGWAWCRLELSGDGGFVWASGGDVVGSGESCTGRWTVTADGRHMALTPDTECAGELVPFAGTLDILRWQGHVLLEHSGLAALRDTYGLPGGTLCREDELDSVLQLAARSEGR